MTEDRQSEARDAEYPPRPGALDTSRATPELYAALAAAQARARTVAKRGRHERRYHYATADDMIAAGRVAREGTGLALITAWGTLPAPPRRRGEDYGAQWIHCTVEIRWALVHASGGVLSGTVYGEAIASKGRPPDKAITAALTYAEGFLERSLMRLDRDEDPDDVDQRADDPEHREAQREAVSRELGPTPQQRLAAALGAVRDQAGLVAWIGEHGTRVESPWAVEAVCARGEELGLHRVDVRELLRAQRG